METGIANESGQFVGIGQPKWRAHDIRRRLTDTSLQCISQQHKSGTFVYTAPDHQRKPPAGTENTVHLAQRCGPIGKELQAQLAIGDIERRIWKWKLVGARLVPLNWCAGMRVCRPSRSGNRQHSRIEVDANHHTGRADAIGDHACDDAGPTCDVNYAVTLLGMSKIDDERGPRAKYGRHQLFLVHLCRAASDLPLPLLAHAIKLLYLQVRTSA